MRLLPMRTVKEEHLYMDLNPCVCGSIKRLAHQRLITLDDQATLASRFAWTCACGRARCFTFVLPEDPSYTTLPGYGGPEPSLILDPGQFLAVSNRHAGRALSSLKRKAGKKRAASEMQEAIWALEEVLKFIGPKPLDTPPIEVMWSLQSQELLKRGIDQFQRARLEARLKAYHDKFELWRASPKALRTPSALREKTP